VLVNFIHGLPFQLEGWTCSKNTKCSLDFNSRKRAAYYYDPIGNLH